MRSVTAPCRSGSELPAAALRPRCDIRTATRSGRGPALGRARSVAGGFGVFLACFELYERACELARKPRAARRVASCGRRASSRGRGAAQRDDEGLHAFGLVVAV